MWGMSKSYQFDKRPFICADRRGGFSRSAMTDAAVRGGVSSQGSHAKRGRGQLGRAGCVVRAGGDGLRAGFELFPDESD